MPTQRHPPPPVELPVIGVAPRERADAARNREKVLDAAERLFGERGVRNVSMDAVAEAACVGKGTLYRRFGDRSGLALALLDDRERELQEAVLHGPPPLGPGAPPADRLVAFVSELSHHVDRNLDLLLASETSSPGARYRGPVYGSWHRHAVILVRAARPDADADVLAHLLLAPLAADLQLLVRRDPGTPLDRFVDAHADLVRAVVG